MVILQQKNCVRSIDSKIPEYARDFKKEYLLIIGINKTYLILYQNMKQILEIFLFLDILIELSILLKRFLKGQERGKLQDISSLILRNYDFSFIEDLYLILIYENDFEDIDNLDYRDFYELFCKFYDQIVCFDDGVDYMSAFDSDTE